MELTDTQLMQRIVGTWTTHPADGDVVSTATYNEDGTGTELVRRRYEPESPDIQVDFLWSIKEGILTLRALDASDKRILSGLELKDRIVSISDGECVTRTYQGYGWGDGEQIVKRRVA